MRNKKFKYYKDNTMKEICGVFDFDRLQLVIMIDDGCHQKDFASDLEGVSDEDN